MSAMTYQKNMKGIFLALFELYFTQQIIEKGLYKRKKS